MHAVCLKINQVSPYNNLEDWVVEILQHLKERHSNPIVATARRYRYIASETRYERRDMQRGFINQSVPHTSSKSNRPIHIIVVQSSIDGAQVVCRALFAGISKVFFLLIPSISNDQSTNRSCGLAVTILA